MGRAKKERRLLKQVLRERYKDFYSFVKQMTFGERWSVAWRILFKRGEMR